MHHQHSSVHTTVARYEYLSQKIRLKYIFYVTSNMTETNTERALGYSERLIQTRDFVPEFHYSQRTRTDNIGRQRHTNVPELWLVSPSETIKLRGTPMRKLVSNYMGYGYRRLCAEANTYENSRDTLNDVLADHYEDMTAQTLCLQERNGQVTRLTTDAFEGIDSKQVSDVITRRLGAEGIEFDSRSRYGGYYNEFLMKNAEFGELGGDVTASVGFMNTNTGENSLSLFGGGNVSVCTNGLILGDLTSRIRLVHKVGFSFVEKKIEHGLGEILQQIELVPKQLLALKEITVTKPEAETVINHMDMEKYLKNAVLERLTTPSHQTANGRMDMDNTLYGVYMAMTYVGTHSTSVAKSKNISVDVNVNHVSKLQDINTLRDAWDLREKELENTDAIKVEQ